MKIPAAIPEIPASHLEQAIAYYVNHLGFTFHWKWGDEAAGIAGISRSDCQLYLTNPGFRESYGNAGPALVWLGLNSRAEVDQLCQLWKSAGAKIVSAPEDKPWNLHEFMAADLDGNQIRVFYDFGGESRA
jgi:predicted lactoylglutathione lyase